MEALSRKLRPRPDPLLPEKVLQFGAGIFLRGFVEDFVDRAIANGDFGGRIVVLQRAHDRRLDAFRAQDGLYTLWLRGMKNGRPREEFRVLRSVSRLLAADTDWDHVRELARSPQLEVVVSNATEVGYTTAPEDHSEGSPPPSFPGKLTALLHERWKHGQEGLLIIPCELIERNAETLRQAVFELAARWNLPPAFREWVERQNTFCATLVDRITIGTPAAEAAPEAWRALGYRDDLLVVAEPFALFAIEDRGAAKQQFPLHRAADQVRYVEDVAPYWRRKLRLLNAPHTLLAGLGLLAGRGSVREALADPGLRSYLEKTIFEEIIPSLGENERLENEAYARSVLERFENPFLEQRLASICFQCSTKVGVRLFPILRDFRQATGQLPGGVLRGIAGVLLVLRDHQRYGIQDSNAARFAGGWRQTTEAWPDFLHRLLTDASLWGGYSTDAEALAGPLAEELRKVAAPS